MVDAVTAGWRDQARRPVVIVIAVAVALVVIGGATALAAGGSGASGYRTATVVRTSIAERLAVVGTVEPVSDASPSFQVSGKVTSVNVAVGATVTAGEVLASLDPTSLAQTVSSDQSTLDADQAKLSEDEAGETSGSSAASSSAGANSSSAQRANFDRDVEPDGGCGCAGQERVLEPERCHRDHSGPGGSGGRSKSRIDR